MVDLAAAGGDLRHRRLDACGAEIGHPVGWHARALQAHHAADIATALSKQLIVPHLAHWHGLRRGPAEQRGIEGQCRARFGGVQLVPVAMATLHRVIGLRGHAGQRLKDPEGGTLRVGQNGEAPGFRHVAGRHEHPPASGLGRGDSSIGASNLEVDKPMRRHLGHHRHHPCHHGLTARGEVIGEALHACIAELPVQQRAIKGGGARKIGCCKLIPGGLSDDRVHGDPPRKLRGKALMPMGGCR